MVVQLRPVPGGADERVGLAQDPSSFERFFDATQSRLFGALCLVTGSRHEAEEIAQEAYVRIWERWDRVAALDDPTGFLFRTAMNVFRSRYRRAALALRKSASLAPWVDELAAVEDRHVVIKALRELAPRQRAAVVLISMFGFTSEEAGSMLGMRPATARALATRARATLRRTVGEQS